MRRGLWLGGMLALVIVAGTGVTTQRRTQNLVLVTFDGVRTQEIFGGLDRQILDAASAESTPAIRKLYTAITARFDAPTPEDRRRRLMPFLWDTLLREHGSIAGNERRGSRVLVTNRHRVSYPGYSEILTGQPHDDVIKGNEPLQNPYATVLEYLRTKMGLDQREIATFGSWGTFRQIVEHTPGTTTVSAGPEPFDHPDPVVRALSDLQAEIPNTWEDVRYDALTFRFARAYLETTRPRVLYIAFDETDDWAHIKRYDRVLESLAHLDGYLRQLWDTLQSIDQYRGTTALVVTTDHGRGMRGRDWHSHGARISGAENIWLVLASPDSERRGEWATLTPLYQNQIAATMAALLGFDYSEHNPAAGRPIALLVPPAEAAVP